MKTLICIPCLLTGGTEIQTLNTVRALVLGGHEVTVACYFEHTPYMVQQFEEAGAKVVLFSPDGVRLGGWRIVPFLYRQLRSVLKSVRPDMVHVQYMAPGGMVILLLRLLGVRNIIATVHTAADIYKDLRLIHFIQRHCVRAWICITERAERSFFGTSQLYSKDMVLGKRNHFTIYNTLGEFSVYRLEFSDSFPFALQTETGKPEQRDLTTHERSAPLNTTH
ncbi:MAG: glycosyltransferase family 4 protein, partial [Prevotellamassilia sp.]|nr:glycosyltransferase family 4 protein [Prevotellamassilia sp.]